MIMALSLIYGNTSRLKRQRVVYFIIKIDCPGLACSIRSYDYSVIRYSRTVYHSQPVIFCYINLTILSLDDTFKCKGLVILINHMPPSCIYRTHEQGISFSSDINLTRKSHVIVMTTGTKNSGNYHYKKKYLFHTYKYSKIYYIMQQTNNKQSILLQ